MSIKFHAEMCHTLRFSEMKAVSHRIVNSVSCYLNESHRSEERRCLNFTIFSEGPHVLRECVRLIRKMPRATLQCGVGSHCQSWLKRAVSSYITPDGNTHTQRSVNKTATSSTNHTLTGTTSLLSFLSQRKTNPSPLQTLGNDNLARSLFNSFSQDHPTSLKKQLHKTQCSAQV